jgi:hypothetical protein
LGWTASDSLIDARLTDNKLLLAARVLLYKAPLSTMPVDLNIEAQTDCRVAVILTLYRVLPEYPDDQTFDLGRPDDGEGDDNESGSTFMAKVGNESGWRMDVKGINRTTRSTVSVRERGLVPRNWFNIINNACS